MYKKKYWPFLQYLCFFVYFMAASLCLYYVVTNMTWLHLQHVLHFIYVYMYLFNKYTYSLSSKIFVSNFSRHSMYTQKSVRYSENFWELIYSI